MEDQNFRVDLRGIVDLLSNHLYSGPRVYVRELLQNAVDALTARQHLAPDATARVLLVPADVAGDGRVHCLDTGVGLTREEVERFLATIGSSSKRDDLGFARGDFLGQFGIGLLSCFLVSDGITVLTRSARGGPAVLWEGRDDGSYRLEELDAERTRALLDEVPVPDWPVDEPGTWVSLRPRAGVQEWVGAEQLVALATEFGRMLPCRVDVATPDGGTERVSVAAPPWDGPGGVVAARAELEELTGVPALAVLPLSVPEAGLRGAALVLDRPSTPMRRQANRVYVKGMLVGSELDGVLPQWAFFVRCVVDAEQLRLTASREALFDDDLLEQVRLSVGDQIRRWMVRTADTNPVLFRRFLDLHLLGVKAMATVDDDLLRLVLPWLTFESTAGPLPLPEVAARFGSVRYTATVDEFRQVAPVAAAQGMGVVNGGYTFDAELIARAAEVDRQLSVELLLPGELDAHVQSPPDDVMLALRPFLVAARVVLDPLDVDVQVRAFDPVTLPALVLDDREARYRRSARAITRADPASVWAQVTASTDDGGRDRRVLLLNHRNTTVARLAAITDSRLLELAVEGLYCQALLAGQHPLQAADAAALNRSFVGLIDQAVIRP